MSRYQQIIRPVWAEINLTAFKHNFKEIRRLVGVETGIMAVVKAEAYGHGAIPIAQAAVMAGASWLGVSLPEEGIALRQAGITTPILVFTPLQINQVTAMVAHNLTATVCSEEPIRPLAAEALSQGRIAAVHLKLDTGMGRVGLPPEKTLSFVAWLKQINGINLNGLFSHLATADQKDLSYAYLQEARFKKVVDDLKAQNQLPQFVHLLNSAGIINLPNAYYNLVRPGIILYGLYPSLEIDRERIDLQPVLSLKARMSFVKCVPAKTGISYGQRYYTKQATTIATIPIGYADGWSRLLSGKAEVLFGGEKCPVVGTICMDQCMIELGEKSAEVGQEVVLIGKQGAMEIDADEVAQKIGTINYEVTCMISDRVPRVYYE